MPQKSEVRRELLKWDRLTDRDVALLQAPFTYQQSTVSSVASRAVSQAASDDEESPAALSPRARPMRQERKEHPNRLLALRSLPRTRRKIEKQEEPK
jgi:hypothetical protein